MSAHRKPRAEIVRSDAGHFARIRGGNSTKVWQTEVYPRPRAALNALRVLGDLLAVGGPASISDDRQWLLIPHLADSAVQIWYVDEREVAR